MKNTTNLWLTLQQDLANLFKFNIIFKDRIIDSKSGTDKNIIKVCQNLISIYAEHQICLQKLRQSEEIKKFLTIYEKYKKHFESTATQILNRNLVYLYQKNSQTIKQKFLFKEMVQISELVKEENELLKNQLDELMLRVSPIKDQRRQQLQQKFKSIQQIKTQFLQNQIIFKQSKGQSYDLMINFNAYVIQDSIQISFSQKFKQFNQKKMKNISQVIGFTGRQNSGKTYLLNLLTNKSYQAGFDSHTLGICAKYVQQQQDKVLFIDTEGKFKPKIVEKQQQLQAKTVQDLIQKFLLYNCHVIIFIVNHVIQCQQNSIQNMFINLAKDDNNKFLIVVHNYQQLKSKEAVEFHINNGLKKIFKLKEQKYNFDQQKKFRFRGQNSLFYSNESKCKNKQVFHCIMANQSSKAGQFYNRTSIQFIKSYIYLNKQSLHINLLDNFVTFMKSYKDITYQKKDDRVQQSQGRYKIIYQSTQNQKKPIPMQQTPLNQLQNFKDPKQIFLNYVELDSFPKEYAQVSSQKKSRYLQVRFTLTGAITKLMVKCQNIDYKNFLIINGKRNIKFTQKQLQQDQFFMYKFQLDTKYLKKKIDMKLGYLQKKVKTLVSNHFQYKSEEKKKMDSSYVGMYGIIIPIEQQQENLVW